MLWLAGGCAARPAQVVSDRLTIVVPGVFGDFGAYDGLVSAVAKDGGTAEVFTWGAGKAAFFQNFSDKSTHTEAELRLASRLTLLPKRVKEIRLIGHSAGCGVVLGALANTERHVQTVILLAPSVSPGYDLRSAMRHVGMMHVFHSDRDTLFLNWRTSKFGTYDRIKTPAAGFGGFVLGKPISNSPSRLVQHPYQDGWKSDGNDGRHMGTLAKRFVEKVLLPLLDEHDDPR
ncbi:MAG: alpha/beta hydrolase [Burkholderiales bacterium]|nr:alpha/beta hydrolase [Phycisphaerae bacterium]